MRARACNASLFLARATRSAPRSHAARSHVRARAATSHRRLQDHDRGILFFSFFLSREDHVLTRFAAAAAFLFCLARRQQTLKPQRRYENLSYLPQLTPEQTAAQVQYLLNNGWSPCIEFAVGEDQTLVQQSLQCGPGFYHNRYWLMWKLPMFGCTDPSAVLKEIDECAKEYPGAQVRVIGFDRIAQVQKAGFLAKK